MLNKTFNQIITEKGEQNVFGNIVDAATKAELTDYFYYRYVCDDEKFIRFFQRNMKQYLKQYNAYLRTENTDFDPFVTRYLERQLVNTLDATETDSTNGTQDHVISVRNGGTVTRKTDNVGTGNVTTNNSGSGRFSNSGTESGTEVVDDDATHSDRSRNILSVFPQANVGTTTGGNMNDNVSYQYATQMTDTKSNGNTTDDRRTTNNNSTTNTGTNSEQSQGQSTSRNVVDGLETTTQNTTQGTNKGINTTERKTGTKSEKADVRERFTGRENYDSGTLLSHARDYIMNTNAFMWYVSKLEKCFIGNLRYGEANDDV